MAKKIAIVTNCTASGSVPSPDYMDAKDLQGKYTHQTAVNEWRNRIARSVQRGDARAIVKALYTGVSFRTVLGVTDNLRDTDHDLFVVSLGFGLVKAEDEITSYNLNIQEAAASPSSLHHVVTEEAFESVRWWSEINVGLSGKEEPLADLVRSGEYAMIVVALSNPFLGLIARDLASSVQDANFKNVRIVGPRGTNWMLKFLRQIASTNIVMPYTPSLSTLVPGNRNDFAQRACTHFVREILIPQEFAGSIGDHRTLVDQAMKGAHADKTQDEDQITAFVEGLKDEDLSLQQAYAKVIEQFGPRMSFDRFQIIWGVTSEIASDDNEMDDALEAMASISLETPPDDNFEVVQKIKLFVQVIKQQGGGTFTVKDVCNWAKIYHDRRNEAIPDTFKRANKVGRLLPALCESLDMVCSNTSGVGPRTYRVERLKT